MSHLLLKVGVSVADREDECLLH